MGQTSGGAELTGNMATWEVEGLPGAQQRRDPKNLGCPGPRISVGFHASRLSAQCSEVVKTPQIRIQSHSPQGPYSFKPGGSRVRFGPWRRDWSTECGEEIPHRLHCSALASSCSSISSARLGPVSQQHSAGPSRSFPQAGLQTWAT